MCVTFLKVNLCKQRKRVPDSPDLSVSVPLGRRYLSVWTENFSLGLIRLFRLSRVDFESRLRRGCSGLFLLN